MIVAVTKTKFINYIRCPRFVALDKVHKKKLDADVSLEDYLMEEKKELLASLIDMMYDDETEEDLIDARNEQLEIMMPYYNKIELLAGKHIDQKFGGISKYAEKTKDQEKFSCLINDIRYLCYVDIYNNKDNISNIVEVKATTMKKFYELGTKVNKEHISIFTKDDKGIYRLLDEMNYNFDEYKYEKYLTQKEKLYDRMHSVGRYVYDLAVQRYIIEKSDSDYNEKKYYLAVLNNEYVYDGQSDYNQDENGNDIISLIDLTKITDDLMDKIDLDRQRIEEYIKKSDIKHYKLGPHCEHKKTTKCKFCSVCFKDIPSENSIFNYIDGHHGFKDEFGTKYDRFDLVNNGMLTILDVPENYLNRVKNQIQRDVVLNNKEYINLDKIKKGLECIKYPVYHLDFETFPCPIPRHKGERPYTQSVFQFSLHIEKEPGKCHKDTDHYEFLAPNLKDHREELVKKLCEYINEGTVLVYNESFEKARLKELSEIFPEYKNKLLKIRANVFDLLHVIKSNTKLYEELGYSDEEAKLFNYYHKKLSGSFSIKKTLPVFSDLSYNDMLVANGMEALATYAAFDTLDEKDYQEKYQALIEYCKQDTWAMVEILHKLNELK